MFASPEEAPAPTRGPRHQKETRALESLRVRIELAVKELARLRAENHALRKEVESLRHDMTMGVDGTPVVFTESPAQLREQIEHCMAIIDRHIESQADAARKPEA
jgi:hypothetical protein